MIAQHPSQPGAFTETSKPRWRKIYAKTGQVKSNTMNKCCQREEDLYISSYNWIENIKQLSLSQVDSCQSHLSQSMNPMCSVRTQDKMITSFSPPWNASTVDTWQKEQTQKKIITLNKLLRLNYRVIASVTILKTEEILSLAAPSKFQRV